MAVHASHTLTAGFVAGPLKNGAQLGTYKMFPTATVETFDLKVIYYNGKLVALVKFNNPADARVGEWQVKEREYFKNLYSYIPELSNSADLFATLADITSIGLTSGGSLPDQGAAAIPFTADADQRVTAYAIPTTADDLNKAILKQTDALGGLVGNLTGTGTTTTGDTAAPGSALKRWAIIGVIVVGIVAIGTFVVKALKK